jgi:putative transposase
MVAMDRALRWASVEVADTMAADMVEAADTMEADMVVEGAITIDKQKKPAAMRAFLRATDSSVFGKRSVYRRMFQRLMADNVIVCSMSRSGNVWDNAAMESFFWSLNTARTARNVYRPRNEARGRCVRAILTQPDVIRRSATAALLSSSGSWD